MANDRILLFCKVCKEVRSIASYYPGRPVRLKPAKFIEDFLNSHLHIEEQENDMFMNTFPIELWTEQTWPLERYGTIPYKARGAE